MIKPAITALLCALIFSTCSSEKSNSESKPETPEPEAPALDELVPPAWAHENFSKVVGYRFGGKGDDTGDGYFTLCRDGKIDVDELKNIATHEVELRTDETVPLLNAVLGDVEKVTPVACYSPHHIFVFYDDSGSARRAIEVCFACNGVRTVPEQPEERFQKFDIAAIAKLCDRIGLWHEVTPVEDYYPIFSEKWDREGPWK